MTTNRRERLCQFADHNVSPRRASHKKLSDRTYIACYWHFDLFPGHLFRILSSNGFRRNAVPLQHTRSSTKHAQGYPFSAMTSATVLRERLPALRRYAFLLMGSRAAADAVLATAIAQLPRGDAGRSAPGGISQIHRAVLDAAGRVDCQADAGLPPLHARLLRLDLPVRAVLLLTVLERLPLDETARICGVAPETAKAMRTHARIALAAPVFPRVMSI